MTITSASRLIGVRNSQARLALLLHARGVGQFRRTHSVYLHQLPADLAAQPLRLVLVIVFDYHFEEQIGSMHMVSPFILREWLAQYAVSGNRAVSVQACTATSARSAAARSARLR